MTKFNFIGNEIYITEERNRYNSIRIEYENIANKAREEFIKVYRSCNENLDDVINNAYDQGASIILKSIKCTLDRLIENKFYNISEELFIEQYCQRVVEIWESAYGIINDQYMNIVLDERQKEEYRQLRKNSRARWQGGGFGIQGAIKGATQAGAMNMATGVAHSAFNMISKIGTSIKVNKQKSKIFNDPSTLDVLSEVIYLAILDIKYSYIKFLENNAGLQFGYIHEEEEEEANVILSNIKGRNLDEEEKINLIKGLIDLNPYMESLYTYIVDNFGDENMEVSKMASYFGFNIEPYKLSLVENKLINLETNTEEETILAKQLILKEVNRLGINSKVNGIEELDRKLNQFDIEARTVDNILFETREDANLARIEKEKVDLILSKINMKIEEEVIRLKNDILSLKLKTGIEDSYIKMIDEKLQKFDIEARTVENLLLDTREEAEKIKLDKIKVEEIINNIDETSEQSLLNAKTEIENIGIRLESTKGAIEKLNYSLKKVDEIERTVNEILFDTREEANVAKKEMLELDEILQNVDLDDEESIKVAMSKIKSHGFKTKIGDNEANKLNKKLEDIDTQSKMVGDILFETREKANLARQEKLDIESIIKNLDENNEENLVNIKKEIESRNFKTEIADLYIDRINNHIKNLYSDTINEAEQYEDNKTNFKSMLIGSAFIVPLGIYFFGNVGIILKIVIGIFLLSAVSALFESYKKLKASKYSLKQLKKLKKSGKII
ncbi:TPA: hypothetical protein ACKO2U_002057 [Clostridioides difficile]|uniref:hypothetical protein n=2 Tax=Clostridioides difficile TaxID=1496 RepID=UPI001C189592|nr:hypothetical protein [Clostridioides difficile]HBF7389525.1 hypothetical protein [Clostridioides difficile]HBG3350867.1 hypothetical protein [Clostridioides difficile]